MYASVYVTEDTYPNAYASLYSVFHSPYFGKVNTNIYMNSAAFNNLTLPAEANGETPGGMNAAISGFTAFGPSNIFAIQINEGIDVGTQKNTFYIYLQIHAMNNFEQTSNKVTSLSNASTDSQYPSAKCVYDLVGNINSLLGGI